MSKWEEIEIKQIVNEHRPVTYGIVQPGPDIRPNGIPLIRGKDYSSGVVNTNDLYHVKPEIDEPYKRSKVLGGDILFSIAGYVGLVAIVPKSLDGANITQTTARISVNQNAYWSEYIFYSLTSEFTKLQVKKYSKGSAQEGLNLSDVEKIIVKCPAYPIQQRIAKILSTADAVIEKTQAAIAKYKAIKQGMLQDLFTRGIDINTNKLRPRYQDAPELYKESKLGMIPREWDDDVLGNIISVSSGEGLTQENIKPGIHLIYGGNGINGSHSEYLFEDSKLIIGRVGEYCGNAYITKPFSWVTDNALVVTPLKKVFLMNFWQYYLNFLDLNSLAFVGAQPVITGGLINKVVVKEIPEDEQILIAERLKATDKKLQTEQTYLQKMQSLKKGLMEDLLSGKKQVKVSEPLMVTD